MQYLGVEYSVKHPPTLDPEFIPFGIWIENYLNDAHKPIAIAVERENGQVYVHNTFITGDPVKKGADFRYVERLVKFLLWSVGGWKVYLCGCSEIAKKLQMSYIATGERSFDCEIFERIYERKIEILNLPIDQCPIPFEQAKPIGGHLDGCRIGFDAGGSDRKVSAVVDGEVIYSEEVVWHPKKNPDPEYQYQGILESLRTAASKMPKVDAIGVSSAGIFINNCTMVSSIFYCVPKENWADAKTAFIRAAAQIGDVPLVVANDGDVSALAGSMSLDSGCVMGLAMGTSEAVGYVNRDGYLLGWLNELAFAPVDLNENATQDEWSTDIGVGCKYFSQDAVNKLAPRAGIELNDELSPAEKLKVVQELAEKGDERALQVFSDIGKYLAYTLVLYLRVYDMKHLMLLGRVMSGRGGDVILETCQRIMHEEYPQLSQGLNILLPDEKTRRVGQSVAAASLPSIDR